MTLKNFMDAFQKRSFNTVTIYHKDKRYSDEFVNEFANNEVEQVFIENNGIDIYVED